MTDISQLHGELVDRVLGGDAKTPPEMRRAALDNAGLDEPIRTLVEKVANRSFAVTDEDVAATRTAGFSEDQIFELMVCAAVGAADRQYNSAMAALAEASGGGL